MNNIPDCANSIFQGISYPASSETPSLNFENSLEKSSYANNTKPGSYKPMSWTIEVKLSLKTLL